MNIRLYLAVCEAEWAQALATKRLSVIARSLEGKWFAEAYEDALRWGSALARLSGIPHDRILVAEFPKAAAYRFFRLASLDGIGPARFVSVDEFRLLVQLGEATA